MAEHLRHLAREGHQAGEQGRQAAVLGERNRIAREIHDTLGKLGAEDRTQAVTIALQRGIIHLEP